MCKTLNNHFMSQSDISNNFKVLSVIYGFLVMFIANQLFFGLAEASAQQPATASDPIYVVDMQKVINDSIIGKAARHNIEEEVGKKRVVLEKIKLEGDKLKEELQKQAALLSPEAMQAKQQQLGKKQTELERAYEDQREEIARKNSESMGNVIKQIREGVAKIAQKNNYKLVIEKDISVVVYVNSKFDISSEVIKLLDSEKVGL